MICTVLSFMFGALLLKLSASDPSILLMYLSPTDQLVPPVYEIIVLFLESSTLGVFCELLRGSPH